MVVVPGSVAEAVVAKGTKTGPVPVDDIVG